MNYPGVRVTYGERRDALRVIRKWKIKAPKTEAMLREGWRCYYNIFTCAQMEVGRETIVKVATLHPEWAYWCYFLVSGLSSTQEKALLQAIAKNSSRSADLLRRSINDLSKSMRRTLLAGVLTSASDSWYLYQKGHGLTAAEKARLRDVGIL
jgi:hypothetical protein